MVSSFEKTTEKAIRMAMARDDYCRDRIAPIDGNLKGFRWLVATSSGLFAVDVSGFKQIMRGWFFGLVRDADHIFLFQNCGMWNRSERLGRILRIALNAQTLRGAEVLVKELDPQCHQIRMIDNSLCVVDTANQSIRRFTVKGDPIDVIAPFPADDDQRGSSHYRHINSIAKIGNRIAVLCHNCGSDTLRKSAVAWLDGDWQLMCEEEIDGHDCHDIVLDHDGSIWHSASKEGSIISNDGRRVEIDRDRMTRGLVLSPSHIVVGLVRRAPRSQRQGSGGDVVIIDRETNGRATISLPGPPCDTAAL